MDINEGALEIMYSHEEARYLTLCTVSGPTDVFSLAARSLPPLDRTEALGDTSTSAVESSLFSLPSELLNYTAPMLPHEDSDDFALVNSDCYRLAHVLEFEHIEHDYSGSYFVSRVLCRHGIDPKAFRECESKNARR